MKNIASHIREIIGNLIITVTALAQVLQEALLERYIFTSLNNVVIFSIIIKVDADSSQYVNKSIPQNKTIRHLRQ